MGGQPGAGKTAATVQAVRDLMRHGGGVVYINGDELRPFHPQYAALVAADRSTAADKTGADVGLWVERAIREAAPGAFMPSSRPRCASLRSFVAPPNSSRLKASDSRCVSSS